MSFSGNPDDVFQLSSAAVEGSTVYPDSSWSGILGPLQGRVTRAQVEAARQEILARYRADGYLLTGVILADGGGGLRASRSLELDGTRVQRVLHVEQVLDEHLHHAKQL